MIDTHILRPGVARVSPSRLTQQGMRDAESYNESDSEFEPERVRAERELMGCQISKMNLTSLIDLTTVYGNRSRTSPLIVASN